MREHSGKRALLTGATGFVGSHLTRRLVQNGWEVHLLLRPRTKVSLIDDVSCQVKKHWYDGNTVRMNEIFRESEPDVVFHLASLFLAQHRPEDVKPLIECNVLLATQLAEAMASHGVDRLVNTGTAWQHFRNEAYCPVNLYAATKQAAEAIFDYYVDAVGLRIVTLKLFDTYGPNDLRPKLFPLLHRHSVSGELLVMSSGEQLIDLVHIDDVVSAFLQVADRLCGDECLSKEEYAVSSGSLINLRDLVAIYAKVTGRKLNVEWGGRPYREREVMEPWSKGKTLPHWKCRVELEKGIRLMESMTPQQNTR